MKTIFTKDFLIGMLNRALRTIAQTALATITTNAVVLSDVNWLVVLSASLLAGIVSCLTSIVLGIPETK